NSAVIGLRVTQAPDVVLGLVPGAPPAVRSLLEAVADAIRQGVTTETSEPVFVGGSANIAERGYFDRIDQAQQAYELLEEQVILLTMLREALKGGDPSVRIGTELPLVELAACSLVVSSYAAGEAMGSLGVLGPTRMDYPGTLAAVQAVASSLEKALTELLGRSDAA